MTGPPAAGTSDTSTPRNHAVRRLRTMVLVAFWLSLLFFPDHPAAPGVLASLAIASAALGVLSWRLRAASAATRSAVSPAGSLVVAARDAWPYLAFVVLLTMAWIAHFDDASTQEYLRQLCFLATVLAVAEGARGETVRWVAAIVIGLALIVVQILGPHSVVDALGRPLHYRSIQQWSGYPEIGLLAMLGAVGCLALALADRRWRVRGASLLLAIGFVAATIFLLSRFSLITIALTALWMAGIAALALRSRLGMTLLAGALLVVVGVVVMRTDLSTRMRAVFVDRSAAVEIRSEGWTIAREMLRDHPVVGVGPGRFREESVHYVPAGTGDRPHAYNLVLHEGAELGYFGLTAYLVMWARALWRTLRAIGRSAAGVAALATHGMLVAFFVRSQSEHFLANLEASFRLLLLLAFLFGLAESLRRDGPRRGARY